MLYILHIPEIDLISILSLSLLIGSNKLYPKINIIALGHNVFYMVVLNEGYESPNLTEEQTHGTFIVGFESGGRQ